MFTSTLKELPPGLPEDSFSKASLRYTLFCQAEQRHTQETIETKRRLLLYIVRIIGEKRVSEVGKSDVLRLKQIMQERNLSSSRQIQVLFGLKYFLIYCRDEEGFKVLDPSSITFPKRERKQVVYLTPEEVQRFLDSIKIRNLSRPYAPYLLGLRFRALVEIILGSGLRISEVLSLDRQQLDRTTHEVKVVGKGRKERTAFLTDRAFYWIEEYLRARDDSHPALFVTQDGRRRLPRADVWRFFPKHRKLAGIIKPITPHILRHTAATQLLFNGCPIGHIKEILGHSRLETTCRYYLGLDQRAAKAAHLKYLTYLPNGDEHNPQVANR